MQASLGALDKPRFTGLRERPHRRYRYLLPAMVLVALLGAAWYREGLSPVGARFPETTLRLVVVRGSWDHLPSLCS